MSQFTNKPLLNQLLYFFNYATRSKLINPLDGHNIDVFIQFSNKFEMIIMIATKCKDRDLLVMTQRQLKCPKDPCALNIYYMCKAFVVSLHGTLNNFKT